MGINDILQQDLSFDEILCEPPGYAVTWADLRPLCLPRRGRVSERYLTDNTINAYLSIVMNCSRINRPADTFIFNANFTGYFEHLDDNNRNEFSLQFLHNNRIGNSNFIESKRLYFPVHVARDFDHWVLICLDREKKTITQFDSLNSKFYKSIYVNFLKFLNCTIPGPQFSETDYSFQEIYCSKQMDSTSCGIYTILNLLTEMNIIDFAIESNESFIRTIKSIMVHEFLAYKNDPECFILDVLGNIDSQ